MIHFAAGLEVPAVGLYGPFKSDLRVKYYPRCIGMDSTHHCCPCFKHGHEHCEEAKRLNGGIGAPCFDSIDKGEIVKNVSNLMEKYGT
jgi:ADP-heptose:LPS heptosyltransferase